VNFSCPLGSACTAGEALDPDAGAPAELADDDDELLAGAADEAGGAGAADEDEDEDPQAVTPRAVMTRTATAAKRDKGSP